jgi:hypothetical protein
MVSMMKAGPINLLISVYMDYAIIRADVPDEMMARAVRAPINMIQPTTKRWYAVYPTTRVHAPLNVAIGHNAWQCPGIAIALAVASKCYTDRSRSISMHDIKLGFAMWPTLTD